MAGIHSKAPDTWIHAQKGGARGQNLGQSYIFFSFMESFVFKQYQLFRATYTL